MARKEHSTEELAQDLQTWIEDSAQKLAAALFEGDASPGAATLTRDERLDYYQSLLYAPDGQINPEGRQKFTAALGPAEQTKVTDALRRRHQDRLKEAGYGG